MNREIKKIDYQEPKSKSIFHRFGIPNGLDLYIEFLNIQKPLPAIPWTETKDCLKFGPRCPQLDDFIQKVGFLSVIINNYFSAWHLKHFRE